MVQTNVVQNTLQITKLLAYRTQHVDVAENYSNSEIPGSFSTDTGWTKSQPTIHVLQHGTSAEWELGRNEKSKVIVACLVDDNDQGACGELVNHLHGYSLSFGCIFRVVDHFEPPGVLHLQTFEFSSSSLYRFVDLWIQDSVFVLIEEEGPQHDSTSVHELAKKVHRHIQEGIVSSKVDAAIPMIVKIDVPRLVSVGTTFVAKVTLGNQYHKNVRCDIGKVIYLNDDSSTNTEQSYTFWRRRKGKTRYTFASQMSEH